MFGVFRPFRVPNVMQSHPSPASLPLLLCTIPLNWPIIRTGVARGTIPPFQLRDTASEMLDFIAGLASRDELLFRNFNVARRDKF